MFIFAQLPHSATRQVDPPESITENSTPPTNDGPYEDQSNSMSNRRSAAHVYECFGCTWCFDLNRKVRMHVKYSVRGYILKNHPGRLLIVTYWTALGVWLTPGGRRFDPTNLQNICFFSLFFSSFFFAPRFATLTVDPLIMMYAFC